MSGSAKGKISGLNLFQRLNFWVVKLGGAILTTPPTLSGVETPSEATIDIKADYEASNGVLGAGAPKVFLRYFYVNSSTGETSVPMQAMAKWAQAAEPDPDEP